MERRFTGLLIPILIATLVYLLFFSKGPEADKAKAAKADPALSDPAVVSAIAQQPQQKYQDVEPVIRTFGDPEGRGFRVVFSRYGAGVRGITLNDHYTEVRTKRKGEGPETHYPVVPAYRSYRHYGLVLEGRGTTRFKKAIDDGAKFQLWDLVPAEADDDEVRFRLDMEDGLVLEKVFRYVPGRRDLQVEIRLVSTKAPAAGTPAHPASYPVRLRSVHMFNPVKEQLLQNAARAVAAVVDAEGNQVSNALGPAECGGLLIDGVAGAFEFAGTTNRFFGGFVYPASADEGGTEAQRAVTSVTTGNWPPQEYQESKFTIAADAVPEVYLNLDLKVPAVGQATSLNYRFYLGPKSDTIFDEQPDYARFHTVMNGDLVPQCCCIPGIYVLAKWLIGLLKIFHGWVGNWGFAIMMLTLVVRMLLSPLNFNMQRTMRAHGAKMAKLKPELDGINKRYKDDPKQLQMEMMKFNREHKLLTAPLKGCVPIFITMPIWFGLFTALRVMYELRHAPFFGWIQDLSQPDQLMFLGWPVMPYFNLLPILMVGLWLYLQMGTPLPKDAQQRQMMFIMRFMPIMMGIFLYNLRRWADDLHVHVEPVGHRRAEDHQEDPRAAARDYDDAADADDVGGGLIPSSAMRLRAPRAFLTHSTDGCGYPMIGA